jgi:hypothetical protein
MKKITDKEYEEFQKYKHDLIHGRILTPTGIEFICKANNYDPYKVGQQILETLSKLRGE